MACQAVLYVGSIINIIRTVNLKHIDSFVVS